MSDRSVPLHLLEDSDIRDDEARLGVTVNDKPRFMIRRKRIGAVRDNRSIYEVWSAYDWGQQPTGTQWRVAISFEIAVDIMQQAVAQ